MTETVIRSDTLQFETRLALHILWILPSILMIMNDYELVGLARKSIQTKSYIEVWDRRPNSQTMIFTRRCITHVV